jgi:hypothetical protein
VPEGKFARSIRQQSLNTLATSLLPCGVIVHLLISGFLSVDPGRVHFASDLSSGRPFMGYGVPGPMNDDSVNQYRVI